MLYKDLMGNRPDKSAGNYRHGCKHTKLYDVWCYMKVRCYNKNRSHYKDYGGRGITVCEEWKNSYPAFHEWSIANGYVDGLEIDRIDNDLGYSPSNCKWSTRIEQMGNRRNTVFITNGLITKTLADWCREFGTNYKLAHARYKKGYAFEKIFAPLPSSTCGKKG